MSHADVAACVMRSRGRRREVEILCLPRVDADSAALQRCHEALDVVSAASKGVLCELESTGEVHEAREDDDYMYLPACCSSLIAVTSLRVFIFEKS